MFYKSCDEMGLLLIQDMPSLRPLQTRTTKDCEVLVILPNDAQQAEFQRQLEILVKQHRNYPSVVIWVCPASTTFTYECILIDFAGHLQRRLGSNYRVVLPRVRSHQPSPRTRSNETDRRNHRMVRPRRRRLLRQPPLRQPTVWRSLLFHPVKPLRPNENWHPRRIRRNRKQRLHRAPLEQ